MKIFLPWVLVVALGGGIYFLCTQVKQRDDQIAKLSEQSTELAQLHAENDELKKISLQKDELDRLRKEHDELLRLRGENQRAKDQIKKLNTQLAAAQAKDAAAQAESAKAQEAQQQAAQLANENQALRNQAQQIASEERVAAEQHAVCINNLRQIDGAKQQWALENKKTADAVPTAADLAPYLPNINQMVCPAGGTYTINAVGVPPTCSVPSHTLPK
ncbi:MAG TPA: hypothetical protein VFB72_20165 [Verrucomicrobiae bacterium]|nr:hypothetical protein [Verrucomicrobiae bacterium]